MRIVPLLWLFLLISGCNSGVSSAQSAVPGGANLQAGPVHQLHEDLRSGSFQLTTAVDSLSKCLETARPMVASSSPRDQSIISQVLRLINAAGETIGDFPAAPPPVATLKNGMEEYSSRRDRALGAAKKAKLTVQNARTLLPSLSLSRRQEQVDLLDAELGAAEDALSGAITAFQHNEPK